MCRFVANKFNHMNTFSYGCASAYSAKYLICLLNQEFPDREFEVLLICGSDHCEKYALWRSSTGYVCVCRPGYGKSITKAIQRNQAHPRFVFIDDPRIEEVSSTSIRQAIRDRVENGGLHEEVYEYLQQIGYLKQSVY